MFNGIIIHTGKVKSLEKSNKSILIGIKSDLRFSKKDLGSSVSCNGVCLTITKIIKNVIFFYISYETLKKTNFKTVKINELINLEKSLFGKYFRSFSQGHVDTTAKIKKNWFYWQIMVVEFREIQNLKYSKFLVEKASITINGVSLTISKITKKIFI